MGNEKDGSAPNQADSLSPRTRPSPDELATQTLIVRHSRTGGEGLYWTSEYGDIQVPQGWEYLPRGDTFITRQVKKGPHWVLHGHYNSEGYTPVLGVFAPAAAIEAARAAALATKTNREQARPRARARREKAEEAYHKEFEEACLLFLDFASVHQELAREIAHGATEVACEKYSGRVGRTALVPLADKVCLAVRAYIRHNHTNYESNLPGSRSIFDEDDYLDARRAAHADVSRFLEEHRAKTQGRC